MEVGASGAQAAAARQEEPGVPLPASPARRAAGKCGAAEPRGAERLQRAARPAGAAGGGERGVAAAAGRDRAGRRAAVASALPRAGGDGGVAATFRRRRAGPFLHPRRGAGEA